MLPAHTTERYGAFPFDCAEVDSRRSSAQRSSDRSLRAVALTLAGPLFLEHVHSRIFQSVERATEAARRARRGEIGVVPHWLCRLGGLPRVARDRAAVRIVGPCGAPTRKTPGTCHCLIANSKARTG